MSAHFSDPRENILQLGLREGMKVGDFGAGSGHYSRALAGVVGRDGKVYAVDVQEEVLKHLRLNAGEHHERTIETVWGDIEKPGGSSLRDGSLDAVVLANVLFQVSHREGLVAEVKRVLKPGGKLLVVDWAGSYGGMGPAPERVVSEHAAEDLFISGGFHKQKSFRGGPQHYAIVFEKPA